MKRSSCSGILKTMYYYLERDNYKVLKFNRKNSSYFKVTAAFQLAPYPKASKLNKRWGCLLGETWYQQIESVGHDDR